MDKYHRQCFTETTDYVGKMDVNALKRNLEVSQFTSSTGKHHHESTTSIIEKFLDHISA